MVGTVASLLGQSVLVVSDGAGSSRYRMLRIARDYVTRHVDGDSAELIECHRAHFATGRRGRRPVAGPGPTRWIGRRGDCDRRCGPVRASHPRRRPPRPPRTCRAVHAAASSRTWLASTRSSWTGRMSDAIFFVVRSASAPELARAAVECCQAQPSVLECHGILTGRDPSEHVPRQLAGRRGWSPRRAT